MPMSIDPAQLLRDLRTDRAISGSEIAARFGVTRAAVCKQMQALRALGAPIEAEAGKGYFLSSPYSPMDWTTIREQLDSQTDGRLGTLTAHWQIDSTNTELSRLASAGAPDLSICLAEWQSAGRGRRGRNWVAPIGASICFSLLKRFACGLGSLSGLSLVAGIALVNALEDCGVSGIGLKWPNDVVVSESKLAGILVEAGGEFLGPSHAIIGIGINWRMPESLDIGQPVTDLSQICASAPPRDQIIARLITHLIANLDRFEAGGFAPFAAGFARHDALIGRAVHIHSGQGVRDGIADGVDERGALRVRHGFEQAVYDSAEVSVRTT
jgi:BirA family biotin operon repressor/biotin-[acetyl-CoA-carboxylase] ligase